MYHLVGEPYHIRGRGISFVGDYKTLPGIYESSTVFGPLQPGMLDEPSGREFHPFLPGGIEGHVGMAAQNLLLEIIAAHNRILEEAPGVSRNGRGWQLRVSYVEHFMPDVSDSRTVAERLP